MGDTIVRQHLSKKKVARLAAHTGFDVVYVLVRGGTDHRQDLCLRDGSIIYFWRGSNDVMEDADLKHGIPKEKWLR